LQKKGRMMSWWRWVASMPRWWRCRRGFRELMG
jgi:hypothetical protein